MYIRNFFKLTIFGRYYQELIIQSTTLQKKKHFLCETAENITRELTFTRELILVLTDVLVQDLDLVEQI